MTRLQRYAAVTFGLNPSKLSEMETECLIGLLTSPARTRRILVLRNEMLRRARSKIDEGGLEGPWCLSRHEATTGLEAYADAGVGARGGGMRRVPGGGGEGGEPGKSEVCLLYQYKSTHTDANAPARSAARKCRTRVPARCGSSVSSVVASCSAKPRSRYSHTARRVPTRRG